MFRQTDRQTERWIDTFVNFLNNISAFILNGKNISMFKS